MQCQKEKRNERMWCAPDLGGPGLAAILRSCVRSVRVLAPGKAVSMRGER